MVGGLWVRVEPRGQRGTGTCPGCVTWGPGCVSSEALGGARLPHSLLPLWYLLVTIVLARTHCPYLLLSARFRCLLMSRSISLRKLSLFSSNCWHCSKTCSMLSMYCGVHLFSSSSTFSYFS